MRFGILGSLEVRDDNGDLITLGGIKPRAVLAVLLLHANEPVSAERLALALWGEDAAESATRTVRVHVSRLRKALGNGEVITTTTAGYRLRVRDDELDAAQFERLVEDGRRVLANGQPHHATTILREALAIWRGPALADLAFEPFARVEVNRLEEERLAAVEARIEADLAVGQHAEIVAELQQLAAANPTRERLASQLMLALYRCGRQTDALEAYRDARRVLVSEIGVEPGPELRELQEAILRQDVALELGRGIAELPSELDIARSSPLVGREDEHAWLRLRWERARDGSGGLVIIAGERGAGKTRLAAELAQDAHRRHDAVLYVSANDAPDMVLSVLRGLQDVRRPTLLVVDDADGAAADVLETLDVCARSLASISSLVLVCCEDTELLAGRRGDGVLTLGPLSENAVRTIARHYASGKAPAEVPVEWLLEASHGLPRRVHEVAGQWARREAARRVTVAAERADTGRTQLRTIENDLVGGVVELQEAGERILPRRQVEPTVVCPFRGLASYDVADAEYFFGRERLVAELVARLVGAPLLGVVGPSGSGKSSVMRAGLLPALASGVLPGSETWKQAVLRPGAHPLRELAAVLPDADGGRSGGGRVVLVVDQLEEAFTICADENERKEFISELLHAALDPDGRYVVVLALRADHYGRCAAHPELSRLLAANNVLVGTMQRDELRRAIEGPCRRAGLRVEHELVEALVGDVAGAPGGLPLLSTALLELWQHRDGRRLRYSTYVQTGGVRGAVARLAEDAFAELDDAQRRVAESVLMRLVDAGDGDAVERRRVALDEFEFDREDVARVVALLTDRRLVTVTAGTIEIAHEALLREWPRLRGWIEHNRDALRIQRTLREAAGEWERLGQDDGALLRGSRLAEAVEWRDARAPSLSELERDFLAASEAARQRDRLTRRRRIGLAFGSLAVALLVISVVAVTSIIDGRRTASREWANRSDAVLAGDPGLALAIGLEALRRHDTPEARNAVRQATLADRAAAVIDAHPSAIYRAALGSDATRLATAGDDATVRSVNLEDARAVWTVKGAKGPVTDVSISPDEKHVASVNVSPPGSGGEIAVATSDGRDRRAVLRLPTDFYARSVEYDRRGERLLIAVAGDDSIRIIRATDGHSSTLASHKGLRVARFDGGGERVLSAGQDGKARLWDLAGGQAPMSLTHGSDIFDARFSPNGQYVATAGANGAVRIWSARSGRLLRELALGLQPLYSVRFSPDGRRMVAGGADGIVRVAAVRGGPMLAELKGHRDRVYDAGFIGRADSVYSVGTDGTVRTWALLKTSTLPAQQEEPPTVPSFSPDGKLVVSGHVGGRVRLWNPATHAIRELPRHEGYSVALYSASGRYVLSADDHRIRLYDVKRGSSAWLPVSAEEMQAVAVDRTGNRLAFAGAAGLGERPTIMARDGGRRIRLPAQGQVVWLAFSADGKRLLSASQDGAIRIWNATSGAPERVLHAGDGGVLQAQFSRDGRRVAGAGTDGTVRIWDLDSDESIVLYGHEGPVTSVGFNADGSQLLSGGKDRTVRLWDARGGDVRVVLRRHDGEVTGVAFSPDGQRVLSGATEGLVVSACEVCESFADVLAVAKTRPGVALSAAERARLDGDPG